MNKFVEDLRNKSDAELAQELVAAKKELFNLRFQNATNQLDNTARIKEVEKILPVFRLLLPRKQTHNRFRSQGPMRVEFQKGDFDRGKKFKKNTYR